MIEFLRSQFFGWHFQQKVQEGSLAALIFGTVNGDGFMGSFSRRRRDQQSMNDAIDASRLVAGNSA